MPPKLPPSEPPKVIRLSRFFDAIIPGLDLYDFSIEFCEGCLVVPSYAEVGDVEDVWVEVHGGYLLFN